MTDLHDVLVVGEGLAGMIAAAAARRKGARVALVSSGPGTFLLGAGAVNTEWMNASLGAILKSDGENDFEQAFTFFAELVSQADCPYEGSISAKVYLPTALGTFQPVSMSPRSIWADVVTGTALVVGIEGLQEINPKFVVTGLTKDSEHLGISAKVSSASIRLPWVCEARPTAWQIANCLDLDQHCWQLLAEALQPVAPHAKFLIVPAMLGLHTTTQQFAGFEAMVGCHVRELPTIPPSVVGWRLFNKIDLYLKNIGVKIVSGFRVVRLSIETDNFIVYLDTPARMQTLRAKAVILATGGIVGELLLALGGGVRTASLVPNVDAELQPLDDSGRPIRNLFIAGRALQRGRPENGNAIAIVTGYRSGRLAAQSARTSCPTTTPISTVA